MNAIISSHMRIPNLLQSATAVSLLVLLAALGTGLPTHSHANGEAPVDRDVHAVGADDHSHGARLVEQDERAPSAGPQLGVLPPPAVALAPAVPTATPAAESDALRPMERAPPPGAPRAPPPAA